MQISNPRWTNLNGICAVEFSATNHTAKEMNLSMRIVAYRTKPVGKGAGAAFIVAEKELKFPIRSKETKSIREKINVGPSTISAVQVLYVTALPR